MIFKDTSDNTYFAFHVHKKVLECYIEEVIVCAYQFHERRRLIDVLILPKK